MEVSRTSFQNEQPPNPEAQNLRVSQTATEHSEDNNADMNDQTNNNNLPPSENKNASEAQMNTPEKFKADISKE